MKQAKDRKIFVLGGSLVTTVPTECAKEMGIKRGDKLAIGWGDGQIVLRKEGVGVVKTEGKQ